MLVPTHEDRKFALPANVQNILKERYYAKDLKEDSWADICARVANAVGEAEPDKDWVREFYDVLFARKFMPNTPTWINAGLKGKRTLSACFVLPLEDSMESILECSRLSGMVQKFGGGVGVNLTPLRAKGAKIASTHGKACGPIAVMRYLAATSQMVTQGGSRAGANIAILDVRHPDVMEFIAVKARESEYLLEASCALADAEVKRGAWTADQAKEYRTYCSNAGLFQLFNLSVSVDKAFMDVAAAYEEWKRDTPKNNLTATAIWPEKLPCGKTIPEVWDAIVSMATRTGDPGLVFLERIRNIARTHSPLPIVGTNPCGEIALPAGGSCNLGSIDLSKFVADKPLASWYERILWEDLKRTIHLGVRFLDDVISVNHHASELIQKVSESERRIGLGIMGWADMLLKLDIPYQSDEALKVAERVAKFFEHEAHEASYKLADEKGAFPLWSLDLHKNGADVEMSRHPWFAPQPRRNASVTCIAPTGTVSLLAGCSSGIEPHFDVGYEHAGMADRGGIGFVWASDTVRTLGGEMTPTEKAAYLAGKLEWAPADKLPVEAHIAHQAAWQAHIDSSISKTVNLVHSATETDVAKVYLMAYAKGTKGCTVYRDRSKNIQVLNRVPERSTKAEAAPEIVPPAKLKAPKRARRPRPRVVQSVTYKVETAEGKMYLTIGYDEARMPFELFVKLGKSGTSTNGYLDAICKLISDQMRLGAHPFFVIRALRGIRTTPHGMGPARVLSVPDAIGKTLEEYMVDNFGPEWGAAYGWMGQTFDAGHEENSNGNGNGNGHEIALETMAQLPAAEVRNCPECGNELVLATGCFQCMVCGYSKCE